MILRNKKQLENHYLPRKHILNNRLDIENAYLISEEDFENVNKRSKVDPKIRTVV
jgi:type I restriction enzyme, S subunit